AERVFRCPAADAIGQPIDRFIPGGLPRGVEGEPCVVRESRVRTVAYTARHQLLGTRADGTEFPLEASVSEVEVTGRLFRALLAREQSPRETEPNGLVGEVRSVALPRAPAPDAPPRPVPSERRAAPRLTALNSIHVHLLAGPDHSPEVAGVRDASAG